jgi:hypothetical protein
VVTGVSMRMQKPELYKSVETLFQLPFLGDPPGRPLEGGGASVG